MPARTHACIEGLPDEVAPEVALDGCGGKLQKEMELLAECCIKVGAGHAHTDPTRPCGLSMRLPVGAGCL
eukprot:1156330-Pelagomonas_calceolata.AAC.1